ncbi:MAG: DUF3467 domain-containing protein [Bacteroidales bacterium]|nr:DUF3467 domain-containing protein [Bacteroidales bacterium]
METQKNPELNIELSPEIASGHYSNLAIITHSSSEFVTDFIQMMPGVPKPKVVSRIILTPENAKRLLNALRDNIERFEKEHGEIKLARNGQGPMMPPIGFGGEA